MRSLLLFLTLIPTALQAQCRFARTPGPTVTYHLQPEQTPTGLVLHVSLDLRTGPNGTETLDIPVDYAGEPLKSLSNLRALTKGATLEPKSHDETYLHARPNHLVTVAYDLRKDWTGPLVNPLQFHPVLLTEYFEINGENAIVRVDLPAGARETANFDWHGLPSTWTLATSFGSSAAPVPDQALCQTYTGPWIDVDRALFAAGDFRLKSFKIGKQPALLAVRGAWTFTDEEAIVAIQKVIGLVRDFWHQDDFPYFLVTLKPFDRDHGSSDGSAFTNAFWMYVSRKDSINGLLPLLAHESFHAWNPFRMGAVPGDGQAYEDIKWFKEGGTEYYAQLLTLKAGELSPADYIKGLNKDLLRFPASTDEYVRGRIISLWLDATIRQESRGEHSLDDVMHDMVRDAGQPYSSARILATADHYLSPESQKFFEAAALHHGDLPAPAVIPALGDCAHPLHQEVPTFDAGFDLKPSFDTRIVSGVTESGPAYAAGLRNGQKLSGYSVEKGEPDRLIKLKVHTETEDRPITYYPRGKPILAWQYTDTCSSPNS